MSSSSQTQLSEKMQTKKNDFVFMGPDHRSHSYLTFVLGIRLVSSVTFGFKILASTPSQMTLSNWITPTMY